MTKFFTAEQVIEIHDAFLEDHGGYKGLLISAVEMPRASMFGEYLHKTIYDNDWGQTCNLVQHLRFSLKLRIIFKKNSLNTSIIQKSKKF
jgi:hypothetical protein